MHWLVIGALGAALAVALGAFGAHGLAERLDARGLELWETSARYLMYGSLGTMIVGLAAGFRPEAGFGRAAVLLVVGATIFSGTVAALALGGPKWLGAITPLGGLLLIGGFLWFAWIAHGQG